MLCCRKLTLACLAAPSAAACSSATACSEPAGAAWASFSSSTPPLAPSAAPEASWCTGFVTAFTVNDSNCHSCSTVAIQLKQPDSVRSKANTMSCHCPLCLTHWLCSCQLCLNKLMIRLRLVMLVRLLSNASKTIRIKKRQKYCRLFLELR